jgi:hypothetical protein
MMTILIIVVLVLLLGGTGYGYSRRSDWGYAPVGGLGTILLILILLWAFGVIRV